MINVRNEPFCASPSFGTPAWGLGLVAVYLAVQVVVPLRAGLDGAAIAWHGRGFNWSWRVMVVEKSGYVEFWACDPERGRRWKIPVREYVTRRQAHFMAQEPRLIRDLARHMAAELRKRGHLSVEVYADAYASLNGRAAQRLIDPRANLAGPLQEGWVTSLNPREPVRSSAAAVSSALFR